jgi:hypothetical protein
LRLKRQQKSQPLRALLVFDLRGRWGFAFSLFQSQVLSVVLPI